MEEGEHGNFETTDEVLNETNSSIVLQHNSKGMYIPLYIYIIVGIMNAAVFLAGTFGNILVMVVVLKVREMRTPTNVFLLNLSVADILVLLVCQPAGLLEFFGKDRWFLGEAMCKLVPFMENGVVHVSILIITAVTLERYNALCHPFKGRLSYTISSTIKTNIVIWTVGLVCSLPFLIMTVQEDARFYDGSRIKVCRTKVDENWKYTYLILIVMVFLVVPLFVLVAIYSKIIRQLTSDTLKYLTRSDESSANTLRSRKQIVKMLILIIVLFFVSLFPIRAVTLWLVFTPSEDVTSIGFEAFLNLISWARILMYISSAGNPIIYSLTSTNFKRAFSKVLSQHFGSHYFGTMSTRFRYNQNARRPVALQQQNREDDDGENRPCRRQENPCLVIKLMIVPECKGRPYRNDSSSTDNQRIPLRIRIADQCQSLE